MNRTRIKICCIESAAEAAIAVEAGADALGLVSAMPSGPGVIPESLIADIAAATRGSAQRFLLTSEIAACDIAGQVRRCGVDTVQMVDRVADDQLAELRGLIPGVRLVQVIHVRGEQSIAEAAAAAEKVDALLLDSGNPDAARRTLGGTGLTHDREIDRRIAAAVDVPVWMAGGLGPGNVADAVAKVRPYGADVCSGVRTDGRLDPRKVADFIAAVRAAG